MPSDDDLQGKDEDKGVREDSGAQSDDAGRAPARRVRRPLPPPITPLPGSGGYWRPKATSVPSTLPSSLPHFLVACTDVVICEAVREFPDQTHCAELCRRVISTLTPRLCAAVGSGSLRPDLVRPIVSDLLRTLVVHNSNYDLDGYRLEQDFWRSDEWHELATEIAQASEGRAASRQAMRPQGDEGQEREADEATLADIKYLAEPAVRQLDRDLLEKYEKLKDEGCLRLPSPSPVYAKSLLVARLRAELAKERLPGLSRIYGEALKTRGRPRTPSILRAILNRFLVPEIEHHVEEVKDLLGLALFRNHYLGDVALVLCQQTIEGYARDVSNLVGIWTDTVEIEARGLEFPGATTAQRYVENVPSDKGEARHTDARKLEEKQPVLPASPAPSPEESRSGDSAKGVALVLASQVVAAGGAVQMPTSNRSGETGQSAAAPTREADLGRMKCKHTPEVYARIRLVEHNPGLSARKYCELFDNFGLRLPEKWREALGEEFNWSKLYCGQKFRPYRKRIDDMISGYKAELRNP